MNNQPDPTRTDGAAQHYEPIYGELVQIGADTETGITRAIVKIDREDLKNMKRVPMYMPVEIVAQSRAVTKLAAAAAPVSAEAREAEQIGWFNPASRRFCYIDEVTPKHQKPGYCVPVYAGKHGDRATEKLREQLETSIVERRELAHQLRLSEAELSAVLEKTEKMAKYRDEAQVERDQLRAENEALLAKLVQMENTFAGQPQAHALAAFQLAEELGHVASSRPPVEHIREDYKRLQDENEALRKDRAVCDELASALWLWVKMASCTDQGAPDNVRVALSHYNVLKNTRDGVQANAAMAKGEAK